MVNQFVKPVWTKLLSQDSLQIKAKIKAQIPLINK